MIEKVPWQTSVRKDGRWRKEIDNGVLARNPKPGRRFRSIG
jgi:hypothetical protein